MDFVTVKSELVKLSVENKIKICRRFYKPDELENIKFLGVPVPLQRQIVKKYKSLELTQLSLLLKDEFHESKLISLLFIVNMMNESKTEKEREEYFNFYCEHFDFINTWDLVDLSAPEIVGRYFASHDEKKLYNLVKHKNFWVQRIAMVSTWYFIKSNKLDYTFDFALILLEHKEDLIQKAVGWMLREAGKKDFDRLLNFLITEKRYNKMPRTMLRYAIEKFPEELRQSILKNKLNI